VHYTKAIEVKSTTIHFLLLSIYNYFLLTLCFFGDVNSLGQPGTSTFPDENLSFPARSFIEVNERIVAQKILCMFKKPNKYKLCKERMQITRLTLTWSIVRAIFKTAGSSLKVVGICKSASLVDT
jgi:hypothetical protein